MWADPLDRVRNLHRLLRLPDRHLPPSASGLLPPASGLRPPAFLSNDLCCQLQCLVCCATKTQRDNVISARDGFTKVGDRHLQLRISLQHGDIARGTDEFQRRSIHGCLVLISLELQGRRLRTSSCELDPDIVGRQHGRRHVARNRSGLAQGANGLPSFAIATDRHDQFSAEIPADRGLHFDILLCSPHMMAVRNHRGFTQHPTIRIERTLMPGQRPCVVGRRLLEGRVECIAVTLQAFPFAKLQLATRCIDRNDSLQTHVVKRHRPVDLPLAETKPREILGKLLGSHEERLDRRPFIPQLSEITIAEYGAAHRETHSTLQPPRLEPQAIHGIGFQGQRFGQPSIVGLSITRDGNRPLSVRTWRHHFSLASGERPRRGRFRALFK